MFNRPILYRITALLLLLSLLLVACERPLQSRRDTTPVEVATVAVPQAAPGETAETATPVPEPVAVEISPTPEPATDQSPRPEATAAPEATPEPEENETAAGEAAPETAETDAAAEEDEAAETETAEQQVAQEAAAAQATPAPQAGSAPTTHTVAPGENLYRVGLRYGVSWSVLAQHNNITNPNSIRVGQVLRIPGTEAIPVSTPALETTYVVRLGDNLYRIGRAYNVSWTQIAEANGLVNPNQVYVGQVLKIPVSAPGPTRPFTHVVSRGETLFHISLRYGVSWQAIAQANNLTPPYVIYVGQTLVIPGG
jgi:LysM repeat protein